MESDLRPSGSFAQPRRFGFTKDKTVILHCALSKTVEPRILDFGQTDLAGSDWFKAKYLVLLYTILTLWKIGPSVLSFAHVRHGHPLVIRIPSCWMSPFKAARDQRLWHPFPSFPPGDAAETSDQPHLLLFTLHQPPYYPCTPFIELPCAGWRH